MDHAFRQMDQVVRNFGEQVGQALDNVARQMGEMFGTPRTPVPALAFAGVAGQADNLLESAGRQIDDVAQDTAHRMDASPGTGTQRVGQPADHGMFEDAKSIEQPKAPGDTKPAEQPKMDDTDSGTEQDIGSADIGGVGNPVPIEGKGSTGRTTPNTLSEQMAMHQVQSDPLNGATELSIPMRDNRWPCAEGWVKMANLVKLSDGTKIEIHFVYNEITGGFDDFKFK